MTHVRFKYTLKPQVGGLLVDLTALQCTFGIVGPLTQVMKPKRCATKYVYMYLVHVYKLFDITCTMLMYKWPVSQILAKILGTEGADIEPYY